MNKQIKKKKAKQADEDWRFIIGILLASFFGKNGLSEIINKESDVNVSIEPFQS